MPKFGKSSKERLATCDPILIAIMEEAIEVMDFTILEGMRGREDQEQAFLLGTSKAKYGESKHNSFPSRAVDIAPWPIDWDDVEAFVLLAGVVTAVAHRLGYLDSIRWGGDWDSDRRTEDERFRDYPHFEIRERTNGR
jgi:peptidoglycan L-alanyl-D-glutamate endopeptidase CwlK